MRRIVPVYLAVIALSGCGNDENASSEPTKKDYEDASAELKEPIGLISAYMPYMEVPKGDGKYDPRPTAKDVQPRQERAANAIRFAATGARQRGKSPVTKLLGDALAKVSKDCTRAEGDEAVKRCKDAISALDVELEKQSKAASDAGASSKMPRIGPDAITDKSKKDLEPYLKTLGPTPKEVETLKGLNDAKADIASLITTCDEAAEEQKLVEATYEGKDEELRKLAVKHRFAIEAICRAVRRVDALRAELEPCKEKKARETPECKLACNKGQNILAEGMPAAAQETFPGYYKGICEEDEKK